MCLFNYVRTHFFILSIIFGFVDITNSSLPDGVTCFQTGACSCRGNNGEEIDLTPLVNSNQPLISASTTELYIYHPCSDVPLNIKVGNDCQNKYGICHFSPQKPTNNPVDFNSVITNNTAGTFQILGLNSEAVLRLNQHNQIEIVYKHTLNSGQVTNTTIVRLECNENYASYKLDIDKSTPSEHLLTLSSPYSCIKVPHHMSGGAIFFIIIIVLVALYFIGGIIVLRFIRGATGVEMIPNHEFWCKLPQLAKDGVAYLRSCGKNTPDSYEKI